MTTTVATELPKCEVCMMREGQISHNGKRYCVDCHSKIFGVSTEGMTKSRLPEGDEIRKV